MIIISNRLLIICNSLPWEIPVESTILQKKTVLECIPEPLLGGPCSFWLKYLSVEIYLTVNCIFTLHWTAYTLLNQPYMTPRWAVLIQRNAFLYQTEHPQPKSYTWVSRLTNTHKTEPLRLRPIELIASESVRPVAIASHGLFKFVLVVFPLLHQMLA